MLKPYEELSVPEKLACMKCVSLALAVNLNHCSPLEDTVPSAHTLEVSGIAGEGVVPDVLTAI